jgi:hypothetical protein
MCILSRVPLYGLLASEGGISAAKNAWPSGIEETLSNLRRKVRNDTLLGGLYQQKEKWVECYMMNIFAL